MSNPEFFIDEAIKLSNSKSFFEYLDKDLTNTKYSKIAELYEKAGNIYKISNKTKAIECFSTANEFYKKSNSDFLSLDLEIKNNMLNIAELYSQIDFIKSIEFYEKVVNYYMEKGDVSYVLKYYEFIGDLYFANNVYENATNIYNKMIQIVGNGNKFIEYKKKATEKISQILIKTDKTKNFLEAGNLYLSLVDSYLNCTTISYYVSKYIYLGIICFCAGGDYVKANNILNEYSNKYLGFVNSPDGQFVMKLLGAIESNDTDTISSLCEHRDKIMSLDSSEIMLLLKIKTDILNTFGNGEESDEIDLS